MKKTNKPNVLGRLGILGGTTLVIATSVGAVTIGSGTLAERVEKTLAPDPALHTFVAVSHIQYEDHFTKTRKFLGQIEATADAVLSFELGGRLAELAVDEGQSVQKGDVIARLDTALLESEQTRLIASRDATAAQLTFAETRLARAEQLQREGISSQETLDQARATHEELVSRIAEVEAGLATVAIKIKMSALRAPFDGRVGARDVEIAETVTPGQMILKLFETAEPHVRFGIPLNVSEEDLQQVTIEVAGLLYAARLQQLRPDIDPITRTRTALFALEAGQALAFGQTANLIVETDVAGRGTWVALDALQQGSGSIWSVLVVEDGMVRTAAVEVLYQHSNRVFVRGSFTEATQLIHAGAHRVVPGQKVQVLEGEL